MAGKRDKKGSARAVVIVRKFEAGGGGGGHGRGAWKVAYADFVTAMMAFFLLMWLLNATTEDQRKGLADYFSPTSAECLLYYRLVSKQERAGCLGGTDSGDVCAARATRRAA